MLPSIRFVWPSCCDCFERTGVGAYRIRPPWRRKSMFDGGDVFVVFMSNHPVQSSCHPWNNRTGDGAYRIRPPRRRKNRWNGGDAFAAIISFPPMWKRLPYSPTPVRKASNLYRIKTFRQMIPSNDAAIIKLITKKVPPQRRHQQYNHVEMITTIEMKHQQCPTTLT